MLCHEIARRLWYGLMGHQLASTHTVSTLRLPGRQCRATARSLLTRGCHLLGIGPACSASHFCCLSSHNTPFQKLAAGDQVLHHQQSNQIMQLTCVTAVSALTAGNRRHASAVGSSHCGAGRSAMRNQPSCRGCMHIETGASVATR